MPRRVSFDEARKCPKCGTNGEEVSTSKQPDGSELKVLKCQNTLCKWYDEKDPTTWLVQVMRDGTVPVRGPEDKDFPERPDSVRQRGEAILKEIEEAERNERPLRY